MNAEQIPDMQQHIEQFLDGSPHAVVGASRNRSKIGYLVLQSYLQNDRMVYPVNPNADKIDGLETYPDLESMPETPHGISVITPPHISETIVEQAGAIGVKNIWLQPGAESELAISRATELDMNVIAGGPLHPGRARLSSPALKPLLAWNIPHVYLISRNFPSCLKATAHQC